MDKTRFAGVFLGLLVACSSAAEHSPPPKAPPPSPPPAAPRQQAFAEAPLEYVFADPDRKKKLEAAFPEIDRLVEAEIAAHKLPGMVFGVVVDGDMPYAKAFGVIDVETKTKADVDTVYRIGSITKSITALAVLSLRDEGKLGLEDRLSKWIPEADGLVYPTRDAAPLTLIQLLTHTSGLPEFGKFDPRVVDHEPTEADLVASLSGLSLEYAPGTKSVYSNLGYALLGIVASRAAKAPFREVVRQRVLDPLGMRSTGWAPESLAGKHLAPAYTPGGGGALKKWAYWRLGAGEGAGGLFSTLPDVGRYVALQLAAYPPRSAPEAWPIRRSSVREAHLHALTLDIVHVAAREHPATGESTLDVHSLAYGFGWQVVTTCDFDAIVQHPGRADGFAAHVAFLPDRGVGIVALTNDNVPGIELGALAEHAFLAMQRTGGLARRTIDPRMATTFAPAMQRFLGVYEAWDARTYDAMLGEGRPRIPREREELAGYKARHGSCRSFAPIEVLSRHEARFLFACERGRLEMQVSFHPKDGLILGFEGTSRDLPAPPKVAAIAGRLAGLVQKWDDGVYTAHLAQKTTVPRAETVALFERLRARHGTCRLGAYARKNTTHEYALACDQGGDAKLTIGFDETNEAAVTTLRIDETTHASCPLK